MKDIRAKFLIVEEGKEFTIEEHDYESFVKALQKNLTEKTVIVEIEEEEYDDPSDMIIEITEPYEEYTIDDAKQIISEAESSGWKVPSWLTPECFIEIYKDCEPLDR